MTIALDWQLSHLCLIQVAIVNCESRSSSFLSFVELELSYAKVTRGPSEHKSCS